MEFSPKCSTKKLGMVYTIMGRFCSFMNWEGADIWHQIRPRIIPEIPHACKTESLFFHLVHKMHMKK